jgi:hypothetical protein
MAHNGRVNKDIGGHMVTDVLVGVMIWVIIIGAVTMTSPGGVNQQSLLGALMLHQRLKARHTTVETAFRVMNQRTFDGVSVGLNDCHLRFHPNGTAAKAGTCQGRLGRVSLRPGESGIGYPWGYD